MLKRSILLTFLSLILINIVTASLEGDWLLSQTVGGKWETIEENALSILALKKETTRYREVEQLQSAILHLKSTLETCMTSNTCNVEDAALSLIALKQTAVDNEFKQQLTTWLLNAKTSQFQEPLLTQDSDELLVQVLSSVTGNCFVSDAQDPSNIEQIELNRLFKVPSNIASTSLRGLNLSCPSLTIPTLSILRKQQNPIIYFILEEERNKKEIIAGSICWGTSYRSSCDPTATAYVLWALKGTQTDTSWLEAQSPLTSLERAILYGVTGKQSYLTSLTNTQNQAGYWDNGDIFITALVTSFLPTSAAKTEASSWLESQKDSNNPCWPAFNCQVRSTAAVLYSGAVNITDLLLDSDGDGMPDSWEVEHGLNPNNSADASQDPDNDSITNLQEYINGTNPKVSNREEEDGDEEDEQPQTGDFCTVAPNCSGNYNALGECIEDNICSRSESCECSACEEEPRCLSACNNDGTCDPTESCSCSDCEDEATCAVVAGKSDKDEVTPKKDEEGPSTLLIISLTLLLLVILILAFIIAQKKGLIKLKKKPKKEEPSIFKFPLRELPKTPPATPPQRHYYRREKRSGPMEKALEESMREMEQLLRKK